MIAELPNVVPAVLDTPDLRKLEPARVSTHPPRILLLYGSLHEPIHEGDDQGQRLLMHGWMRIATPVASEKHPLSAISLAEVFATSDLPGGVVNVLTGNLDRPGGAMFPLSPVAPAPRGRRARRRPRTPRSAQDANVAF